TPSTVLATYNGSGFTMKYPQGWKTTASSAEVDFTDTTGNTLTIGFTPNPNSATSPAQLADGGLAGAKANLKDPQTVNFPATTAIGGQTWSQRAVSGTSVVNGQSENVEAVILATNHPNFSTDTKGYTLIYVASKDAFDTSRSRYFMPMLQSFAFTNERTASPLDVRKNFRACRPGSVSPIPQSMGSSITTMPSGSRTPVFISEAAIPAMRWVTLVPTLAAIW
ncbi:MAG: hypothetical protein ABI234_19830, partial [Ktedonobacteraceae bacterium]